MLTLEEMLIRLVIAVVLGAIIGFERELVGKEAGVRTDTLVAAGATLFTIAGIMVHYVIGLPANDPDILNQVISTSRGIAIIAGIVTGIGFLGAGLMIQDGPRVKGITTAASIWFVAAVGILVGLGLIELAVIATIGLTSLLFILRKIDFFGLIHKEERIEKFSDDSE